MKKLLLIFIVLGTMSCNIMQYGEPKFAIGMTEQEFKNSNKSALSVYGDEKEITIYRTYNQLLETCKFFVFSKGKLVKFEEGTAPDDFKYINLQNL